MASSRYTLLLLDDAQRGVRRITIHRRAVAAIASGATASLVVAAALVVHYALLTPHVFEARELRRENAELGQRLTDLEEHVRATSTTVASLTGMGDRLRAMTGVPASSVSLRERGLAQGGPFASDTAFAIPLAPDSDGATQTELTQLDGRERLLSAEAVGEERSLEELVDYFKGREAVLRSTPSIAPARGFLTSGFGTRADPFTNEGSGHSGDDIAAPIGTDVVAPADGLVILAGENGGYGNCVILEHRTGLTTLYGHLSKIVVKNGERVVRGERIGQIGTTGRSTGPHLHYEVRTNGVPLNPRRFIIQ